MRKNSGNSAPVSGRKIPVPGNGETGSIKKARARRKGRTRQQANRASNSFRDFVRRLPGTNPLIATFKVHAADDAFPDTESWRKIRFYLVGTGASHEAMVGARLAWREFQSR